MMKNPVQKSVLKSKVKGFAPLIALVVVAAVALTLLFAYQKYVTKSGNLATTGTQLLQKVGISLPTPTPAVLRSKAPGVITDVVTAKEIDAKSGEAVNPTSVFSQKDTNISLVVSINKSPVGTRFEYVRYLNGKYLDNRSVKTTKAGVKNVSFSWKLKTATSTHLPGTYRVKTYTQGVFEKEVSYTVR